MLCIILACAFLVHFFPQIVQIAAAKFDLTLGISAVMTCLTEVVSTTEALGTGTAFRDP